MKRNLRLTETLPEYVYFRQSINHNNSMEIERTGDVKTGEMAHDRKWLESISNTELA